jgi:hypothetical protein
MTAWPNSGERLQARSWSPLAEGGRKQSFDAIGRDSPGRSAGKVLRTSSAIPRMVSTMARKNATIFAAHGAMMQASAALAPGVLVM